MHGSPQLRRNTTNVGLPSTNVNFLDEGAGEPISGPRETLQDSGVLNAASSFWTADDMEPSDMVAGFFLALYLGFQRVQRWRATLRMGIYLMRWS
jgi:hypothetical protein